MPPIEGLYVAEFGDVAIGGETYEVDPVCGTTGAGS